MTDHQTFDFEDEEYGADAMAMSRRALILGAAAVAVAGCQQQGRSYASAFMGAGAMNPAYRRRRVRYETGEKPGTIIVETQNMYLYVVEDDGMATRYGVGVGRAGAQWSGRAYVGRKAEWPRWTPTEAMMMRDPRIRQYAGGVEGGENNPLGARALYLYRNGRDTMYRLHGTNVPQSIGTASSSGCIRLYNDDVIHLYERTPVGARVVVT